MNEFLFITIFCAVMNSFTACYLYPKYHLKVFIFYSLLLPVCIPIVYSLLDRGYIYIDMSLIAYGIICILLFSVMFFYSVWWVKEESKKNILSKKIRTKCFLGSLVLNIIYFFMTGRIIFSILIAIENWLPQFKFKYFFY